METKTYKAETMIEALQLVQMELGPNAVVLSAREVPAGPAWDKWKRTSVEVVAVPPQKQPAILKPVMPLNDSAEEIEWVKEEVYTPAPKTGSAEKKPRMWQPAHVTREEVQNARRPADVQPAPAPTAPAAAKTSAASAVATQPAGPAASRPLPGEADLPRGLLKNRAILQAQGVEESFLDRTTKLLLNTINPAILQDEEASRKYLFQILEAELRVLTNISEQPPARVVCMVGTSGSGKTTTTAKMAVYYSQQGKRVTWVCADTIRTGAIAQGRAYAEALGLPFKLAYTPDELKAGVVNDSESDLILVDMAGYNPMDETQVVELGAFITELPNRKSFLVSSATAKDTDSLQAAAALGIFGLDGIVVTKLDETNTFGSVFNVARKSRVPLAFLSYSKDAIDRFAIASSSNIISSLFGKRWLK